MPDTSKLFKRVYLEIGNTCNLHCSFCSPRTRPARQMTLPEFTSALMQLRPYTDSLYFHVKGEPLFHPLLESFLREADARGFRVTITT
ncbi:MAG: radical SAM protein, partial [Candidatus Faecivivens sp.]|nr:radical SAM protein [Candidatus Faecivivens sp.]